MPRCRLRCEGIPSALTKDKGWYLGIVACVCVLVSKGKFGVGVSKQ